MSIVTELEELESINNELKRVRSRLKKLQASKTRVENIILDYLESNNQPGLRYKGKTIIAERKNRRTHKKKSEKYTDAERVLQDCGVSATREVLEDILEAMRGDPVEKNVVKMF
jgi:hypothetical protein